MICPSPRIADVAPDDGLPQLAATVLAHPGALLFLPASIEVLERISAGDQAIAPAGSRKLLKLALVAIEAVESLLPTSEVGP